MAADQLDLSDTVATVCSHYGFDLDVVASIRILPTTVEIVTYRKNERGLYIDPETDKAAADTHTFPITNSHHVETEPPE